MIKAAAGVTVMTTANLGATDVARVDVDRSILNVGNYAIDQGGGTATVRGSQLISTTTAWYSSPGVLRIAGSRIVGVTAGSCTGSSNYDGNYAARVGC